MKKIIAFLILLLCLKQSYAQYPLKQYLGSDSTLVTVRGGMNARVVLWSFTDTTQANTQRISQYAGALIYTTGTDKVWYRNSTATGWIEFTSSGGTTTNIYNSDGFITGTRVLDLSASPLTFSRSGVKQFAAEDNLTTIGSPNNQKRITVYNDSITILGLSQTTDTTTYKPLAIDADGYFTVMDRWPGGGSGSIPTLQQVLTAGSTLTGVNDIHLDGNEFRFLGGSGDFLVQDVNLIDLINDNDNGIQIGTAEGVLIRPNVGVLKIDTLNYTLSTTGKKILIRDTATGLVQNIDPSLLGASSYTFTNGLTDSSGTVKLGGDLVDDTTTINAKDKRFYIDSALNIFLISRNTAIPVNDARLWVANDEGIVSRFSRTGRLSQLSVNDIIDLSSDKSGVSGSDMIINPDSIQINPHLGIVSIDTLAAASNMTNKRVMTWDTVTKRWEQISKDSVGGSGGISAIGTIDSETKSANGAVISGSNLVMQTADATYPGLLTSSQYSFIDSVRNGLVADSSYLDLVLGSGIYDSVYAYIKPYGEASWDSSFQFLVVKAGEGYTFTNGLTDSSGTVKLGGTLTEATTTLDGGTTKTLRFQDMQFEVTNSNTLMLGDSISLTGGATPNRLSVIILKNDTIKINPGLGLLYIDTLTSAVGTKALRYNPTTGLVSYADTTTGGGDTLTYSSNPSEWVTLKSPNNPVINSDMYTPNPLVEHTQYAPSPIIAWDGNVWNYVKGDGYNAISVYKSTDRGESFNFIDTVIVPRSGTYYSQSATIPGVVADSANNLIHIYFQALDLAVTPDVMSIGYATAPYNDPSNVTISDPLITPADFVTQTGITYQPGYLNITSVVKTDSIYYFGTFWDGNADHPTGDFKIFMGSSDTWDTIRNCRVILSPSGSYDLVRSPSVFLDNGLYKMIYTNGYIDNDSLTTLVSAYSSNLKTWTPYNGTLLSVGESGSWEEKRVYMAQVLKKSTGTFADPYFFPKENYGYPANDNYTDAIKYYYSGSNNDSPVYSDFTGLAYLYPQRGKEDFFISEADTNVSVINRNTTHVINIPNASDSTTGKLKSEDWTTFNNKAPGSGSTNYIQNKSATVGTAQASASFHIADSATIGKVLHVGGNSTSLYALNVNANVGVTNLAGLRIYNSGYGSRDWYWQINASTGEIAHGATGTSGSYTLGSFASGMLWQSSYWRWRANQSPFNYIFEIDGGVNNAVNIVPSAGKLAVGGYTKDSTMTLTGSLRVSSNVKFGGKVHAPSLGSGNGTKAVRWDATNGLVLADTAVALSSGTQTPTATNSTNVSASTPGQEQYMRVGNTVTVSGYIEIDCTSASVTSEIDLSLPVPSAFSSTTQLSGIIMEAISGVASPGHGTISSNSTNDRVSIIFTPRADTNLSYRYTYTYQVL